MAEHTEDQDDEVRALIRAHLSKHGASQFKLLDAAAAPLGYTSGEVEVLARPIVAARGIAADADLPSVPSPPAPRPEPPARPSPPRVRPQPMESYAERLRRIDQDAQKIRAYALKTDPDSEDGTSIKFPNTFLAALHQQAKALELHMKVGDAVFALDRVEAYFKRLGEIIRDRLGEAAPELADAVLADFDALNAEFMGRGSDGG